MVNGDLARSIVKGSRTAVRQNAQHALIRGGAAEMMEGTQAPVAQLDRAWDF
jgi:hypothetical protein